VLRLCQMRHTVLQMKTISVKLPESLAAWVARRSKELGRTQSELVREALEQRKAAAGGRSCAALLEDLGGFFEGPPDLSTNPKYLNDFGR
jgi:Ribbon-helix-helix protein, copG family